MAIINRKKKIGGIFLGAMTIIGIGYAALSNIDLKITGDAVVGPSGDKFNVKLVSVKKNLDGSSNPLSCEIASDGLTAHCTANLEGATNWENTHNNYGENVFTIKYTGSDSYDAGLTYEVSKSGSNNIEVGVSQTNGSDGLVNKLSAGESADFSVYLYTSARAQLGDKIDFTINIKAKPIEKK